MELLEYWQIVRKRLWLIALLVAVAVSSTVYFSLQQPPEYQTTTTLFLNPASTSPLLPTYVTRSAATLASTYAEFMRTRSFADLVAQDVGKGTTPGEVLRAISTHYVGNTQFFKIITTHSDPEKAQQLASSAAETLIAANIARQQAQQSQIQAQQDPVRELERQRLRELQQSLEDELDYYADQIANLQAQIAELEESPPSQELHQRILALRAELNQNQSLRVDVLGSLAQTQASLASGDETSNVDTAVVVDEALLPTQPLPRQLLQYVLFAIAASVGLGTGLAFLLEYLDYTVKTPEELDAVYDHATLGVIGKIDDGGHREGDNRELVTLTDPRSPIAEAFRSLRTNIHFTSPGETVRSLLITSAGPAEGKSLIAANLAVSLAQGGNRVILVDADLRKPRLQHIFGIPREPGFTNLIIDQAEHSHPPGSPPSPTREGGSGLISSRPTPENETDGAALASTADSANIDSGLLDGYLQPTDQGNLWILPGGTPPPNPAELLGSPRAAEIMQQLQQHADIVVYDTPPVVTVTDAAVLASRVDGVIQVVKAGSTRRDHVTRGRDVLNKVSAHILGPVLNEVRLADLGYYSYHYYYGYYQEGNGSDADRAPSLLGRIFSNGRSAQRQRKDAKGQNG